MSNVKTALDSFAVEDLVDGSQLRVHVEHCTEVGNDGKPGLQVLYLGNIVCFEPRMLARLAYQAEQQGQREIWLEDRSWAVHQDQFVKLFLVLDPAPAVRVEVKTRSRKTALVKSYPLPWSPVEA